MKLIIDIDERDYDLACKYPNALIATYAHYIKDGTPLPKGHGRLVDIDNLYAQRVESNNPFFTIPELGEVVPVDAIENYATTILASDKETEYGCILPEGGRE